MLDGKIDLLVFDHEGAYFRTREQDFAAWSPAENTDRAAVYVERVRLVQVGDSLTP